MKKYIVSWAVLFAIYFVAVAVWINYAPAATQIGTNQIKNSAITNPKIANDAVTEAKFDSASGITVATAAITGAATASKLVSTGDIVAAATGSFADIDVSDHIGAARADIGDLTVSGSCTGCGGGGGSLADAMNVGATAPVALDMRGFDITHFAAVASGTTEFRYNADILSAGILGFEINEGSALYFPSAASGEIFIGSINLFGAAGLTITNGAGNPVIEIVNDQNSNTAGIGVGGTGSNGTIQVRNNAGAANITLGGGTGNAGFGGNLTATGTINAIGGYKVGAAIGVTCTLTMDLSATATVSITKGIITGCTGPACSCP